MTPILTVAIALPAALSLALFVAPVRAAELHDGDVLMSVSKITGKLKTRGGRSNTLFEGDFGDLAGGLYGTDDPGYDSADGTFANGTQIHYRALGALKFWDGSSWKARWVPSGVQVRLDGNLGEATFWGRTGVSGAGSGLIGQAGAGGNIHEHLDMSVVGDNRSVAGAYMIRLQLWSPNDPQLLPSSGYSMLLNRGLSEAAFEAAVVAALPAPSAGSIVPSRSLAGGGGPAVPQVLSAVPEPSSWALMLFGLVATAGIVRHRVQRS